MVKRLFPQKIKNIYHFLRTIFCVSWFRFPSRQIKVIGVTGTNGKTTTVQMIDRILEEAGYRVAVLSTINFKIGQEKWINKTKYTTLNAWQIQKFIKKAVKADCEYLVLEVSSHALDQKRVWGVDFDVSVITNVTREHLDYHLTMSNYRKSKAKLFKALATSKRKGARKVSIVNLEMKQVGYFLSFKADERYGYFVHDGELEINSTQLTKRIMAEEVQVGLEKNYFKIDEVSFNLQLPGRFNIENALASICVGVSQGINLEVCSKALKLMQGVPGRMEEVENELGIKIFIDYALTPDSMNQMGELMKKVKNKKSRLIWVFGSCGNRDQGKRPIMGQVVAKYADFVIVTNEDPYDENPLEIIEQVFLGVLKGGDNKFKKEEGVNAFKVENRKKAIKKAINLASRKEDIILITGKGAEETMMTKGVQSPWSDRKVIQEALLEVVKESK